MPILSALWRRHNNKIGADQRPPNCQVLTPPNFITTTMINQLPAPGPLDPVNRPLYLTYRTALTQNLAAEILLRALFRCDRKAIPVIVDSLGCDPVAVRQVLQIELETAALRGDGWGFYCPYLPDLPKQVHGVLLATWSHIERDFYDYDPAKLSTATPAAISGEHNNDETFVA